MTQVLAIANFGVGVAANHFGSGRHIFFLELPNAINALLYIFISEFLSLVAICFVKISVALFLLRIGNLRRWLRLSLVANIILLASSTFAFVIILFVQCKPLAGNWNPVVKATANCISPERLIDVSYITTG